MAASAKDRKRAQRVRRKGSRASTKDREWLARYDDAQKKRREASIAKGPPASGPILEPASDLPDLPTGPPEHEAGMVPVDFPEFEDYDDDDDDDDDDASTEGTTSAGEDRQNPPPDSPETRGPEPGPLDPHGALAPVKVCDNPDCPACRKRVGGSMCQATGAIVWDPIDIEVARGMAMALFGAVGLAVSFFRKDKVHISPNDLELDMMAKALQKSTYRRLNALGAYDDLIGLFTAMGMYVRRASQEKAP